MRRLAAFARKMASLARRLRSTSASGRPLPGSAGRAAPGDPKRSKVPADSRGQRYTAETQTSRGPFPAAAGKIGTGGRKVHSQSRVASKGAEVLKSSPSFADALSASSTSATSTSLGPLHPPPHADRDFWFKFMMLGGSSLGFVIHLLKGYVDKEVELKMKGKEAEDRAKIIKEKEKELEAKKQELELKKQELEIATEEKKRSAWFWH